MQLSELDRGQRTLGARLEVARTDLDFFNVAPDRVRFEVTVHNRGTARSATTPMRLEVAPLGAFLAWEPLTELLVPPIPAGDAAVVATEVPCVPRQVDASRGSPPRKLLTATAAGGGDRELLRPTALQVSESGGRRSPDRLAAWLGLDVLQQMGVGTAHFAGNLNVHIGRQSVERHVAGALRVFPGRDNVAMFVVGRRPDAYRFEVTRPDEDWIVDLVAPFGSELFVGLPVAIPPDEADPEGWWETPVGKAALFVRMRVPASVEPGAHGVHVHVTQRSTGRVATVEFSLDPSAAGPGCYTL